MAEEGAAYRLAHLYAQMRTPRFFREVLPTQQRCYPCSAPALWKPSSEETGIGVSITIPALLPKDNLSLGATQTSQ